MNRMFVLFILAFGAIRASEARAEEGSPVGEAGRTYLVQPRDRLERVAERFGTTAGEIISANPPRAFIRVCVGEREITLRNGEIITICRRVKYQLKAGATLAIPTPRLLVESENVRLAAENTALVAERNEAERERDSLKQERDALLAEREELKRTNEATLRAKAELQARYDELKQTGATTSATSSAEETNGDSQNQSATYSREGFLAVIVMFLCGALFIGALALYRYLDIRSKKVVPGPSEKMRKVNEEFGRIRREREDLDATRRTLAREGQDLVERRRQVENDELEVAEGRIALDKERESLRTQRDELGRWEENLAAREAAPAPEKPRIPTTIGVPPIFPPVPTGAEKAKTEVGLLQVMVARGRQLVEEDFRTLAGREAACTAREKAIERRAAALDSLRQALEDRERNLTEKEHGVEELRRTFSSGKARCDLKDADQTEREESLVRGFADLKIQQERAQKELDAKRPELDRRASEIDAKVRMYDEDILPAIKRGKEDLAARAAELDEQKNSSDRRQAELDDAERGYERRLKELNDTVGALDERAEKLAEGERKLGEDQLELKNQREEFANAVDEAKSTLTRAKKKKALVEAIDAREAAIARREGECDTREGALEAWEERLTAREGLPRVRGPHRPTLSPPPLALPAVEFPPGASAGDDDVPTSLAMSVPPEDGIDPSGITHIDPPGSEPAVGVSKCICAHCGEEIPLGGEEEHKPVCAGQRDALGQTGPHIPVAERPSHEESGFYCKECHEIVASTEEDYRAHQDKHHRECGAETKPEASGDEPAESPSRCVCPQCGGVFPWEEIEDHKCVS